MADTIGQFAVLVQAGAARGACLVRLTNLLAANRYAAVALEFDDTGATRPVAEGETLLVTNLAEPADAPGQLSAGAEAVALDVEGRWVIFLRPDSAGGAALFPARVLATQGSGLYTVRPQVLGPSGEFSDAPGAADLTARNLAELSLGPGAAVPNDTIILATILADTATPPTLRYVFDHPAYAKYLT